MVCAHISCYWLWLHSWSRAVRNALFKHRQLKSNNFNIFEIHLDNKTTWYTCYSYIYIYVCVYMDKYIIILWLYSWSKSNWWTSVSVAFLSKAQSGKGHHEQPLNTLQTNKTIGSVVNENYLDSDKFVNEQNTAWYSIKTLKLFVLRNVKFPHCWQYFHSGNVETSQYLLDHHISKLLHELHSLPSSCEAANWSIFLTQVAGHHQVTALVF